MHELRRRGILEPAASPTAFTHDTRFESMRLERVCVFAGAQEGTRLSYRAAAEALGRELPARGIGLVYGGSSLGLMGRLADAALAEGGEVIGVLPSRLQEREGSHDGLTELRIVGSLHERKARSAELSSGFVALPGGLGSLDELIEILSWSQLGLHAKPVGMVNVDGYFDRLIDFFDLASREGFLRSDYRDLLAIEDSPARVLDRFEIWLPRNSERPDESQDSVGPRG